MCYFSTMKQRIPAFLKPGDLIGLSATARFATQEIIDVATKHIEKAGFRVHIEPDILLRHGQVAGTVAQRIESFNRLIHHKEIKAIWNVRGDIMLESVFHLVICQNSIGLYIIKR